MPLIVTKGIVLIVYVLTFDDSYCECNMTNPCADRLGQGNEFQEPAQESSVSKEWSMTLTVDIATITYDWLKLKRRLYNGNAAGPTITVKRGDQMTLNLINNLAPERNDLQRPMNQLNHPNTTNLHTHGLHISSESPQDDVLIGIGPKQRHQFVYQIHADHSPGTYWYHAHFHGSTLLQVHSGLSGILIVEDGVDEMPRELSAASCPDNCDKDIQLLFQPMLMFDGKSRRGFGIIQDFGGDYEGFKNDGYNVTSGGTLTDWLANNINLYTTNGQYLPTLDMLTGQMYRFRMVNAGGEYTHELYITDVAGQPTTNCDILEIALDGVYLAYPRSLRHGLTILLPGARVDWLLKCSVPGTYKVASVPDPVHNLSLGVILRYRGDLVTLVVSGADKADNFPKFLPKNPPYLSDLRSLTQEDIKGRFVVELNPQSYINRELWSGPSKYRYKMALGEPQEWHMLNTDVVEAHPLHMHVNHFQVISYNNYTGGVPRNESSARLWYLSDINDVEHKCDFQYKEYESVYDPTLKFEEQPVDVSEKLKYWGHDTRYDGENGTLGYERLGDWRDVLVVPPLSNITIRFVPTDYHGNVMIHCHNLAHEDTGMMMLLKIVKKGESTSASVKSGNAYPGTCRKNDRYPPNNVSTLNEVRNRRLDYIKKILRKWQLNLSRLVRAGVL